MLRKRDGQLEKLPASHVTTSDRPAYIDVELDRPQLYFSPAIEGYAIVGTEVSESPCGEGGATRDAAEHGEANSGPAQLPAQAADELPEPPDLRGQGEERGGAQACAEPDQCEVYPQRVLFQS